MLSTMRQWLQRISLLMIPPICIAGLNMDLDARQERALLLGVFVCAVSEIMLRRMDDAQECRLARLKRGE